MAETLPAGPGPIPAPPRTESGNLGAPARKSHRSLPLGNTHNARSHPSRHHGSPAGPHLTRPAHFGQHRHHGRYSGDSGSSEWGSEAQATRRSPAVSTSDNWKARGPADSEPAERDDGATKRRQRGDNPLARPRATPNAKAATRIDSGLTEAGAEHRQYSVITRPARPPGNANSQGRGPARFWIDGAGERSGGAEDGRIEPWGAAARRSEAEAEDTVSDWEVVGGGGYSSWSDFGWWRFFTCVAAQGSDQVFDDQTT